MKSKTSCIVTLAGCITFVIFMSSCGDPPPPEKSTHEKLNSSDAAEQEQGLNEASKKYGDKQ